MGIADILDETVELYKSSFVLLVGIAAVMNVPYSLFERYYSTAQTARILANPGRVPIKDMTAFWGATAYAIAFLLLTAPIITGALTYAISERYLGRKVTIWDSFKRVLSISILWRLLITIFLKMAVVVFPVGLAAMAVGVGAVSMITGHATLLPVALGIGAVGVAVGVGAVYVLLRLAVLEPTIVVERKTIGNALSRAWGCMPGSMVKCFVLLLLGWLVTTAVEAIVSVPTQMIIMAKAGNVSSTIMFLHVVVGAIASTILAPVMSIVTILLYYDIRIRREGLDLELLANDLDAKTREISAYNTQPLPQEQVTEQVRPKDESGPQ